jgi:hypothetical protein
VNDTVRPDHYWCPALPWPHDPLANSGIGTWQTAGTLSLSYKKKKTRGFMHGPTITQICMSRDPIYEQQSASLKKIVSLAFDQLPFNCIRSLFHLAADSRKAVSTACHQVPVWIHSSFLFSISCLRVALLLRLGHEHMHCLASGQYCFTVSLQWRVESVICRGFCDFCFHCKLLDKILYLLLLLPPILVVTACTCSNILYMRTCDV